MKTHFLSACQCLSKHYRTATAKTWPLLPARTAAVGDWRLQSFPDVLVS
jgi:hypothetical protein